MELLPEAMAESVDLAAADGTAMDLMPAAAAVGTPAVAAVGTEAIPVLETTTAAMAVAVVALLSLLMPLMFLPLMGITTELLSLITVPF